MGLQLQHIEFQGGYFSHYYLCNYRPRHTGSDELSKSLIRFKERIRVDVEAWTECALMELGKVSLNNGLLIMRALGRDEKTVSSSSRTALDWLGRKLADELKGSYMPELLSKSRNTRSVKWLTRIEREIELQDVYSFKGESVREALILDDILTTGTTMKEIIKAIRAVLPSCRINLFTLANTDHQALLNQHISLAGYSYTWQEEEWKTVAESEEFYNEFVRLKSQILKDSFE